MSNITNWYGIKDVKKHITKYSNPKYKEVLISHPHRTLIIGGSGSGKTTCLMELIKKMADTYDFIILCVRSADEPLYKYLISKCRDLIMVYEDGKFPSIDDVKKTAKDKQVLMIFDDLVLLKDQSFISEMFIRGRKIGGGVSMCYLTQSYYKCPKTIRINCNNIILKKLSSNRDLKMILREYDIDKSEKEMLDMYKNATANQLDSLIIRLDEPYDSPHKFTKNFLEQI